MTAASEYFDFQKMSKRVLGKTWRKLSKKDQEYMETLLLLQGRQLTADDLFTLRNLISA